MGDLRLLYRPCAGQSRVRYGSCRHSPTTGCLPNRSRLAIVITHLGPQSNPCRCRQSSRKDQRMEDFAICRLCPVWRRVLGLLLDPQSVLHRSSAFQLDELDLTPEQGFGDSHWSVWRSWFQSYLFIRSSHLRSRCHEFAILCVSSTRRNTRLARLISSGSFNNM